MRYPPKIGGMPSRVLARLLKAERLSHLTFQKEASSYRLSAPIEILRNNYGWPISSQWRTGKTNDPVGRSAKYCVYILPLESIREAGIKGKQYASKVFEWEQQKSMEKAGTFSTLSHNKMQSEQASTDNSTSKSLCGSNGKE